MTRLSDLRKRLRRLRRRRARVRLGTGISAVLIAVLWVLAAAFLVDWLLQMSQPQRVVSLALCASAVIWAYCRFTLPWLGRRETELDMALLVERQEDIDTDLIAAVQFESALLLGNTAAEWGSVELEQAVIDQTAARGKQLKVMKGLSRKRLYVRLLMLLLTAGAWAAAGRELTDHVSAFAQRFFLLSSVHYPTRTIIDSIALKSHEVLPVDPAEEGKETASIDWTKAKTYSSVDPVKPGLVAIKILYGHRVRFEVACSGELPEKGEVVLTAKRSGSRKTILLQRVLTEEEGREKREERGAKGAEGGEQSEERGRQQGAPRSSLLPPPSSSPHVPAVYAGELEVIREAHDWQLYLGDAWTDPAVLNVTQLPVIDVELEITPPPYATADPQGGPQKMPAGLRQVSVIEGSRVRVNLRTESPLENATLTVVSAGQYGQLGGNKPWEFQKTDPSSSDDPRDLWTFDGRGSPLSAVTELIRYQIDVTDVDAQHLQQPIPGVIRIQSDAPPRIAAAIVTRWVLPEARPTVYFRAIDDYGLASVAIDAEVTRDASSQQYDVTHRRTFEVYKYDPDRPPPLRSLAPETGYPFDLSPLNLKKGHTVTITLRATDFRGPRGGKSAAAEALVFRVTDRQGILAAMMETDRQSARELKSMIQRQLGIGESP